MDVWRIRIQRFGRLHVQIGEGALQRHPQPRPNHPPCGWDNHDDNDRGGGEEEATPRERITPMRTITTRGCGLAPAQSSPSTPSEVEPQTTTGTTTIGPNRPPLALSTRRSPPLLKTTTVRIRHTGLRKPHFVHSTTGERGTKRDRKGRPDEGPGPDTT